MMALFSQLFGWVLNKSEEEKEQRTFYLKSFLFLVLIVIIASNRYWDMTGNIQLLLGTVAIEYVITITRIGIHFFTTLSILAFVVLIVSAIIYEVIKKISIDSRWCGYFNRLRIGAELRLSSSVEDVLLLFLVAWVFNKNIIVDYANTYSEVFFMIMVVSCILQFVFSTVAGILNRFFVVWSKIS